MKTSATAHNEPGAGAVSRSTFGTYADSFFSPAKATPFFSGRGIQAKLTVGQPDDAYEREADTMAEKVVQRFGQTTFLGDTVQRKCAECEKEENIQKKETGTGETAVSPTLESRLASSAGSGSPLPDGVKTGMENGFGADFSAVRIHTGAGAAQMSRDINAQAFTHGNDIYFNEGKFSPGTTEGKTLLAHELTHTIQQKGMVRKKLQRTLGDGHDLASPRFSKLLDLEAAYDSEKILKKGGSGRGVQAVQMALYDIGFRLPKNGSSGDFDAETESAVKAFQKANPPLGDNGTVDAATITALDKRFPAVALASAAIRSGPWTPANVMDILCPWSPHTVEVLATKITLKSFDSISWADEEWDGKAWKPAPFPGCGYNTGTEIGVLNSSCEEMAATLYHEVLHAEQPKSQKTTLAKESYAYRIGEEFSIAMGIGGFTQLRSTDAQGRQYADPAKVDSFVKAEYPSVPIGGAPTDEIIGKGGKLGEVLVQRANGSQYTRPAAVGEKVPGPMKIQKEVTHPKAAWKCP